MRIAVHLRRIARDEGGFSLIELLTALSILLIVIGSLTTLFVSAMKSEVDLTQRVRAQQEARLALERIRHEIHRACIAEHVDLATGSPPVPAPAGAYSTVRLTPPVPPPTEGCPLATDPATAVTWCTELVATNRWRLRRVDPLPGPPPSCTVGRIEADYLTTGAVFTLEAPASLSLAKVKVTFPVDIAPAETGRSYRLEDHLVLRNSERAP